MVRKTEKLHESTERLDAQERSTVPLSGEQVRPAFAFTLEQGQKIGERYEVLRVLAQQTGEADLYLCKDALSGDQEVVVKLYRGAEGAKDVVLSLLAGIEHPDIIALLDYGVWEEHLYEVMQYARGGSLAERLPEQSFSEQELVETVIPEVANALAFCHSQNPRIIHRDLKPSNIFFLNEDGSDIVIGDFGISSILEGDTTHRATTGSRTPDYAAPEIYSEQMGIEADYYAFGITLVHLFSGYSPMQGLTEKQIMFRHLSEEIPLPDSMSERMKQLARGLITKERKHRWGAGEIERWLAGEDVPVYHDVLAVQVKPYELPSGRQVRSIEELAAGMQEEWQKIKPDVGRGYISRWLATFNQGMARRVGEIEESNLDLDLKVLSIIYTLDPTLPFKLMQGKKTTDPAELAQMIDADERSWRAGREKLFNDFIPTWLQLIGYEEQVEKWRSLDAKMREDKDHGLEAILELLDPDLPEPSVNVNREAVDFGRIEMGSSRKIKLVIENNGRGYLAGQVRLEKELEGVKLSQHEVRGRHTTIEITLDASKLPAGRRGNSRLVVETNSDRRLELPVAFHVGMPLMQSLLRVAMWMGIGAIIFGFYRLVLPADFSGLVVIFAPILVAGIAIAVVLRTLTPADSPFAPLFAFKASASDDSQPLADFFGAVLPWIGAFAVFSPMRTLYETIPDSVWIFILMVWIGIPAGSSIGVWLALSLRSGKYDEPGMRALGNFGRSVVILMFIVSLILGIIEIFIKGDAIWIFGYFIAAPIISNRTYFKNA